MARPVTDKRVFYGDDHRWVLAHCVGKARQILRGNGASCSNEELMAEGWWRYLRRCQTTNELRMNIGHCICAMIDYGCRPCQVIPPGYEPKQVCYPPDTVEIRELLAYATRGIDDRVVHIGILRYGHGHDFRTIGDRYGISGERARQLSQRFLAEARHRLETA